jgi:hypothetical protein
MDRFGLGGVCGLDAVMPGVSATAGPGLGMGTTGEAARQASPSTGGRFGDRLVL